MKNPKTTSICILALAAVAVNSHAATRAWSGAVDNDFTNAGNWNTFPSGSHNAMMEGDAGDSLTVLDDGNSYSMNAINVRGGHTFTIDNGSGTLTGGGNFNMGRGVTGTATVNQVAGTVDLGGLDMGGNEIGGDSLYTISGGSLTVGSADTFDIGADNLTGTNEGGGSDAATFAIVGDSATVTVTNNILARATSMFSFTLGASGIDAIDTTGTFTMSAGAGLTVNGSSYTGGAGTINLFSYASAFDATEFNETITGFSGFNTDVVYGASGIDLVVTSIPEPSALGLLGIGVFVLALRRRR